MLKTNSVIVRSKIRALILDNYSGENYDPGTPEAEARTLEEIAKVILSDVLRVEGWKRNRYGVLDGFRAFCDWSAGLPSMFDCGYYYNISAVNLLGDILEETEAERAKYTESQAEEALSRLIYRELEKAAPGVWTE